MSGEKKRVLLAICPDPSSKYAFDWYFDHVYLPSHHVIACHIPDNVDLPSLSFKEGIHLPAAEWQKKIQGKIEENEKLLRDYEFELVNRKVAYNFVGGVSGERAKGVLKHAEEEKADLIVVGNRGSRKHGLMGRGSTSQYIIMHSHIPVIVVPMMGSQTSL